MMDSTQLTCVPIEEMDIAECLPCAESLACLEEDVARRLCVLPIAIIVGKRATELLLVCADVSDLAQRERVSRHISHEYQLRFIECPQWQLVQAIDTFYRAQPVLEELLLACDSHAGINVSDHSLELPVELVNALLVKAASMRASDIHLSPEKSSVQIRLRVDGVLLNLASISTSVLGGLLVRIKIMASLDIAETRYPQDGRFRRVINGHNVDFRVSTFPTVDGENTVLRLINAQIHQSMVALGLPVQVEQRLSAIMRRPEGLIVVCGPTGAGKSTTLFALLDKIDIASLSVMTLEDPVEHHIAGIRQTSIDATKHWGYPQGLRALLRQDPDVLLIGEIRDAESCAIALRAVSTGHQVLTTVHASSAHAALQRLRELDADGGALALGLEAVIAQRLLRQVCQVCKGIHESCSLCHGTGYSGRHVIMELLEVTEPVKALLVQGADVAQIRELSHDAGFVSLYEQAMKQVESGRTTLEEVSRVLGDQS